MYKRGCEEASAYQALAHEWTMAAAQASNSMLTCVSVDANNNSVIQLGSSGLIYFMPPVNGTYGPP